MLNLINKEKLLRNFLRCENWEEKYLYIIELGNFLYPMPINMRTSNNLISGCQSKVWIFLIVDSDGNVKLYGDSDAAIVKGFIAIIFILYKNLTLEEILLYDVRPFFKSLSLTKYLTKSRTQGLESMVRSIRIQAAEKKYIYSNKNCL